MQKVNFFRFFAQKWWANETFLKYLKPMPRVRQTGMTETAHSNFYALANKNPLKLRMPDKQ
jgi:hypothetical protein